MSYYCYASVILVTLTSLAIHLPNFSNCRAETPADVHGPYLHLELRHRHAVTPHARVIFADIPTAHIYSHKDGRSPYQVKTRRITTYRPPSFDVYTQARRRSMRHAESQALQWDEEEIVGPDVESRETLLELAKMTNNAYVEPEDPYWYDLEGKWSEVRRNAVRITLSLLYYISDFSFTSVRYMC